MDFYYIRLYSLHETLYSIFGATIGHYRGCFGIIVINKTDDYDTSTLITVILLPIAVILF
jgi:hypothetical protein